MGTPYLSDRDDILDCLDRKLNNDTDHSIVIGDLNGKTQTALDYVLDLDDKHSPINENEGYDRDTPPNVRNNMDTKPVDKQGRKILEICQTHRLRILNGRTVGDRWGHPTRYPVASRETPSLLDYTLCSQEYMKKIKAFQIQPITELSDHCCITFKLETSHRPEVDSGMQTIRHVTKGYRYDIKLAGQFTQNLKDNEDLTNLKNKMDRIGTTPPSQDLVDSLAQDFGKCVVDTAIKTFPTKPPRTKKPAKQLKPAKWFNDQCSKLKKAYKRALTALHKKPFDAELKHKVLCAQKSYKKACKGAEAKFRETVVGKLLELSLTDPKGFWKTLKDMREWGRQKPDPSDNIQPDTWKEYYKTLLNKPTTKQYKAEQGQPNPLLDRPLLLKELLEVIKRAKWGKASGPDHIQIELVKDFPPETTKVLFKLMQMIFNNAMFPKTWTVSYLRAIYKKDDKEDPNNYRGLAIAPIFSKLYSMILLKRLEDYVTEERVISPNQIGFQRGYRTADHVYLLKTLVNKAFRHKKKLYAAFIDFKKAYDTVDRTILLKTLHRNGVQGNFLRNLEAMYAHASYTIKLNKGILEPISSNLGLKQGCPLSPLLFNLYINDLGAYLEDEKENSILDVQGTKVNHFLYADDLVLLSETKEGLQEQLNGLEKFAQEKELTVNTKKSVVMVFNKAGRKTSDTLLYENKRLEIVQSFTYLGIEFAASGTLSYGVKALIAKAKKAMMPLFRTITQFNLPFRNILRMFTALVEPILLYNAENWACMTTKQIEACMKDHNLIYENSVRNNTTIAQLKYLKFALGVSKQCPTMAVLGETAEIPLILKGYHRMLTFWERTRDMEDDTLIKKAYMENVATNSDWCKTIQILNSSQNLHSQEIADEDFSKVAKQRIRNNFTNYWKARISDQTREKKLHIYAQVKQELQIEQYMNLSNFRDRQIKSNQIKLFFS